MNHSTNHTQPARATGIHWFAFLFTLIHLYAPHLQINILKVLIGALFFVSNPRTTYGAFLDSRNSDKWDTARNRKGPVGWLIQQYDINHNSECKLW